MNAYLQRAKKMPNIDELLGDKKPPSVEEIKAILESKPTFEQKPNVKAK